MEVVVVRGRSENQVGVPECIRYGIGRMLGGHAVDGHVLHAPLLQQDGELLRHSGGVPVDGGVGYHDALVLGLVAAPEVVLPDYVSQVLLPYGSVEGADHLDLHSSELLDGVLHLGTVPSDDVGVVPPRLLQIIAVEVHLVGEQRSGDGLERSECIRREQDLAALVVCEHDLRPVDHHGEDEPQDVGSDGEGVPVLHHDRVLRCDVVEVVQHLEGLRVADDRDLGIRLQNLGDAGAVVRLHVVDHQIVQVPSGQRVAQIPPELGSYGGVHGVEEAGLAPGADEV